MLRLCVLMIVAALAVVTAAKMQFAGMTAVLHVFRVKNYERLFPSHALQRRAKLVDEAASNLMRPSAPATPPLNCELQINSQVQPTPGN